MGKKPEPEGVGRLASAGDILEAAFDSYVPFHEQEDGTTPVPYQWVKGDSNLVVITGENASGKSLARRFICAVCQRATPKVEPMTVSMQGRTSGGPMSAFIYGGEDFESTGQISARTVTTGIKTCRSRTHDHMVFWDEPDLGLSDSWAAGVGVAIAEFVGTLPEKTKGVFVVTHSKALVEQLLDVPHHFVHFGDGKHPADLAAWHKQKVKPRPIDRLGEVSHKRFRRIQVAIDANQKG